MEQSPVRPASAGGRLGAPSRSRGTAVAAGGSAVSPADVVRTVQRPTARATVSVSLILAPVARHLLTQEGDNFSIGGWGGRASRRRRRRAPGGGAHGTPKGTRPARIPEED